ncbi:MAG: DUF3617 domain-containing protein [Candidatus Binataceae bacterium]
MKRSITFAATAASALLIAAVAPVRAAGIKPGKWEFTTEMTMPGGTMDGPGALAPGGTPQIPPGMKLPPNVHMWSNGHGMTITDTSCMKADDPVPKIGRNKFCTVDKMERHGGAVNWVATCKMLGNAMRSKGEMTYHGNTMDGTVTNVISMGANGSGMTMTQHITGKYLGPCD